MRRSALIIGILGTLLGVFWAIFALVQVGNDPLYHPRLWAGVAALIFAVLAGSAALLIPRRPGLASIFILLSGVIGFLCINLFFINTWYILALLCWIAAALLALLSARARDARR